MKNSAFMRGSAPAPWAATTWNEGRWRLACLSPRIFCPRGRPMLSRKGGEKRRERTGDLTVPDARRNDEDRASTHEDVNGFIVGQEDHLDLAVERSEEHTSELQSPFLISY